jgi:hypothetical protein
MAPVAGKCGYAFHQVTCGTNGDPAFFWNAICLLILESPPASQAEKDYVNANFGPLGITATGCNAALMAANMNVLKQGVIDGYAIIQAEYPNLGVGNQNREWRLLPFDGTWKISQEDLFARAVGYAINPNEVAVYWTSFWDNAHRPLSCANGATYKVEFQAQDIPVDQSVGGFWSVTLYTETMFLNGVNNAQKKYAIRGTSGTAPVFTLSANCVTANCLPAPPTGTFHLMFRGYAPGEQLLPRFRGDEVEATDEVELQGSKKEYRLPDVQVCNKNKPCN